MSLYFYRRRSSVYTPCDARCGCAPTAAGTDASHAGHFPVLTTILVVAVYATNTKDSPIMPLDRLADICAAVSIPVVAIGGITAENAAPTINAGCAGVAVVSAIFGAENPCAAATRILQVVDLHLGL